MNIVITGAAGLLGSHLSKWLLDHTNHTVFGIDDLSGGYIDNVPEAVSLFKFDLAEDNSVDRLFKKINPDIVYHFAAYAAEGLSPFMRSFNYKNNLIATSKVINACINYKKKEIILKF